MVGKKGEDIVLLDIGALSSLADYTLLCSAGSEPQVWAIVDAIETVLKKRAFKPLGIEAAKPASWVLIDCDDIIVHIFNKTTRQFYNLDGLWADASRVDFSKRPSTGRPKIRKRSVTVTAKTLSAKES